VDLDLDVDADVGVDVDVRQWVWMSMPILMWLVDECIVSLLRARMTVHRRGRVQIRGNGVSNAHGP
jgi:hypothetical protein